MKNIRIVRKEFYDNRLKVIYQDSTGLTQELDILLENADVRKLSDETLKKIILLAELTKDVAEDIEFDNDPSEHGFIHPNGWTLKRYTDEMGGNTIHIWHSVYESNE